MLGSLTSQICRCGEDQQAGCRVGMCCGVDGCVVCHRRPGTRRADGPRRPSCSAPKTRAILARSDMETYPDGEQERVAAKCGRQGLQLYTRAVEEADALPRISGTGVEYQHRRKLHAPDSHGSKELDPYWKRTGRAKSGSDPLRCRKLPSAQDPRARLPGRHPARTCQHIHPPYRESHTLRLGRKPSVNVNRVVPLTDTKYHCLPFLVWCISGSRSPLEFLVDEGA